METRTLTRHVGSVNQLRCQSQLRPVPARVPTCTRHLSAARASKGGQGGPGPDEDKSWGEIIQDAAGVAKSVFNKLKDTAFSIIPTAPSAPSASAKPAQTPKPEAPLGPSLGGGLLPNLIGRAVGGLVSSALSSLSAQLEEAAKEQAGAYEEAAARLKGSAKLQARLGTVNVGPVMSQSSSTSSINGVVTKQITLVMPVYGTLGGGTAQVAVVEGPRQPGGRSLQITVRTSDGGLISVDDGGGLGGSGGRGGGRVIDVEFREVKKP